MAQTVCRISGATVDGSVISPTERNHNSRQCALLRPQTHKIVTAERAHFCGLSKEVRPLRSGVQARAHRNVMGGQYGVPLPGWMQQKDGISIMSGTQGEELEPSARQEIKEARAKAIVDDAANEAALDAALKATSQAADAKAASSKSPADLTPPKPSALSINDPINVQKGTPASSSKPSALSINDPINVWKGTAPASSPKPAASPPPAPPPPPAPAPAPAASPPPPRASAPPAPAPAASPPRAPARAAPASSPKPAASPAPAPDPVLDPQYSMPAGITAGGGFSQVRVYEQLLELRQKMASRLSETNRHARFLEGELSRRDVQVKTAQARLKRVSADTSVLVKTANQLAKDVKYSVGINKETMAGKLVALADRLHQLEQLLDGDIDGLESMSVQTVPITWFGVAQSIKLMGSFDNWTAGFELSPEDYTFSGDQLFEVDAQMLPGTYEVKFLVDGEWRLSDVWPMSTSDWLSANNLLTVDAFTNPESSEDEEDEDEYRGNWAI